MPKAKHCGNQVGVPQQARQARGSDKKQGSTCGKRLCPSRRFGFRGDFCSCGYGPIKEEVYVEQPPGFEDDRYPDHVYKLSKVLYGLKQAPRAWYECLRDFVIANAFKVGKADPTLFTKTCDGYLFVCQIYVDDIIFGSTNQKSCEEFSRVMM
jgi:hypothetical protein